MSFMNPIRVAILVTFLLVLVASGALLVSADQADVRLFVADGKVEETDIRLNFLGNWTFAQYGDYTEKWTDTLTNRLQFQFYGDGFTLYTASGPDRGFISVCVDGTCTDTSLYNPDALMVTTRSYTGYAYGTHTVTIEMVSGSLLAIDGVQILGLVSTPTPTATPTEIPFVKYETISTSGGEVAMKYEYSLTAGEFVSVVLQFLTVALLTVGLLLFVMRDKRAIS